MSLPVLYTIQIFSQHSSWIEPFLVPVKSLALSAAGVSARNLLKIPKFKNFMPQ